MCKVIAAWCYKSNWFNFHIHKLKMSSHLIFSTINFVWRRWPLLTVCAKFPKWCLMWLLSSTFSPYVYDSFSALASKKRSNQKNRALYTDNWRILFWLSYSTFLIWPLFRSYGRCPGKNFVGFLGDLKTPKGHFEINWPLTDVLR